jgi:hypothetical protein
MSHHHEEEVPLWVLEILERLEALLHSRHENFIIEWLERILYFHRRKRLAFTISFETIEVQGVDMTFTMLPTQNVSAVISPVQADGTTPSLATLSAQTYTSSDPSVLTAVQDPTNPNAVIVTGLGVAGSAIVTATATATEPDGTTTEVITGAVTVILAVPPPAPAAALIFTFGTPVAN